MSWRSAAKARICSIYLQVRNLMAQEKIAEARAIVKAAYPFGERAYTPYKTWCEECRKAFPGLYPAKKQGPTSDHQSLF